jgi:hypothetical protein
MRADFFVFGARSTHALHNLRNGRKDDAPLWIANTNLQAFGSFAFGKKSCWPLILYPAMAFWPSGEISQSTNCWPRSFLTFGCLAGFTSTTLYGTVLTTDTNPTSAISPAGNAAAIPVEDEASSLHGLGGYHGSVHPTRRVTIYYAIGVFSERRPNGSNNGFVAFDQPWKNAVATFYHELNEARTDPDVEDAIRAGNSPRAVGFLGWTSQEGEECGDFPITEAEPDLSLVMKEVSLTNGDGKVPVQFQYSNAVQGPEGPIPQPHV